MIFPGREEEDRDMASYNQQRARLTHISMNEPSLEAVRAPVVFVTDFAFSNKPHPSSL